MASLPAELLPMMCEELAPTRNSGGYTKADAIAPYCVAAVCHRWRNAALRTRVLWAYAYVPLISTAEHCSSAARHVATMLERSGSSPLDVHVEWALIEWNAFPVEFIDMLLCFGQAEGRWRCFWLFLTDSCSQLDVLDISRGAATPLLEELRIAWFVDDINDPRGEDLLSSLPDAPRL